MWKRHRYKWYNERPVDPEGWKERYKLKSEDYMKIAPTEEKEVKKISYYKPFFRNGSLHEGKVTVFLKRPFHPSMSLTDEERKQLPLPVTPVSNWVSLTPFPIGSIPQKATPINTFYSKFLSDTGGDGRELIFNGIVHGGWATNRKTLSVMCTPRPNGIEYSDLDKVLDDADLFGLPFINSHPYPNWIHRGAVNPDASPGLISKKLLGPNKREAYDEGVILAKRLWNEIVDNEPFPDTSLWEVGGRGKRCIFDDDEEPKSRIVLMPEFPPSLIGNAIAQPITESMLHIQNTELVENWMGHSMADGRWQRLRDYLGVGKKIIELDWSTFDVHVHEKFIVTAFGMLRSCYPPSKSIDKIFLYLMSGFIFKNVAIPGRFVYRIRKGVPSGSPFTALVDTIVNWLALRLCIRKCSVFQGINPRSFELAVCGDDTLIKLPDDFEIKNDSDDFIKEMTSLTGFELKSKNFTITLSGTGIEDLEPSFLKTIIWNGLPGRDYLDLIESISAPEAKITGIWKFKEVLDGYLNVPLFNPRGRDFLFRIHKWIGEYIFKNKRLGSSPSTFNALENSERLIQYRFLMRPPPSLQILTEKPHYLKTEKFRGSSPPYLKSVLGNIRELACFGGFPH